MKGLKIGLAIAAAFVLTFGLASMGLAFHDGGVGKCSSCHSMHNDAGSKLAGKPTGTAYGSKGPRLLIGSDPSSTCLNCHQVNGDTGPKEYHVSTPTAEVIKGTNPPKQRTPGGDFGWLRIDYAEKGTTRGHNIVAADFSYGADTVNSTAPGGTMLVGNLGCNSCHDPHSGNRRLADDSITKPVSGATGTLPISGSGSYSDGSTATSTTALGVYRLLAGPGYSTDAAGAIGFTGVPQAVVPATYNQTEVANQVRVAYGNKANNGHETWSNWCLTCHPNLAGNANHTHPVDQGLGSLATNYKNYVKSGDLSNTDAAKGYLSLVPFAENGQTYTTLASHAKNDNTYLNSPSTSDQVTCLSCHRAHASGFSHALRWNPDVSFLTFAGEYGALDNPATDSRSNGGRNIIEVKAGYNDRTAATTFAVSQRSLCNKCHAWD